MKKKRYSEAYKVLLKLRETELQAASKLMSTPYFRVLTQLRRRPVSYS